METMLTLIEDEKVLFAREKLKTVSRGWQIELSHNLSMHVLSMS